MKRKTIAMAELYQAQGTERSSSLQYSQHHPSPPTQDPNIAFCEVEKTLGTLLLM